MQLIAAPNKMNLRFYITAIVLLAAILSCNTKSGSVVNIAPAVVAVIPDTLVYNVINWLVAHKSSNPNLKSPNMLENDGMGFIFYFKQDSLNLTQDSLFSEAEVQYIFSQRKQFEAFKVDSLRIIGKTVIPYSSLEKLGLKTHSAVSFPLFNIDRTIFIIRTSYYCGALCATTGAYIYKKKGSGWILVKAIYEAIS